jgi:dTDP-4-amino-4,6-dideoxygalactose transaminase
MTWRVQLSELSYDEAETRAVEQVLKSQWLTMGERTLRFEQEFSNYLGSDYTGVATSSATAGLHLILRALDLPKGSEVIVPALTFVSDVNVVLELGLVPVLADCSSFIDFNVSDESIIKGITSKTKAIVIVHFAGYPKCLNKLKEICEKNKISLIEDVAHAPGASINQSMCGTLGDFGFFSFFSNKNLACGEGGFVTSSDKVALDRIRLLRSHGMSAPTLDRHEGRASTYDIVISGFNYRIDEIRSSLAIEQLKKLDGNNKKRGDLVERYFKNLEHSKLTIPFAGFDRNSTSAYHIFPVLLPSKTSRMKVIENMKANGIQTSIHYPSFKSFTAHKIWSEKYETPIADEISARELTLPLFPTLQEDEVDFVSEKILEALSD